MAAFLGSLAGGCSTTEGRCEDYCEVSANCAAVPARDCQARCESQIDDAGESCQEAFDDLTDCLSEEGLECSKVESKCTGDLLEVVSDCRGQFDVY